MLGLAIAAALALGACGDDNQGNGGDTGATAPTTTATTDTGTTGTTERERTGTTREDRTTTRERGDDRGGRDRSGSGGGGSNSGSDGSGSGSGSGSSSGGKLPPPGNDTYSVARRVCNQFLPFITARQLKEGKTTPQKVAGDYSRAFPKRKQKRAYDGCLKGLNDRG
jgi:hypothetical protein